MGRESQGFRHTYEGWMVTHVSQPDASSPGMKAAVSCWPRVTLASPQLRM